ncbi:MAG: hypothetical protein JWL61_69 [Gemmatimonadetes bacterium]|nr:hypothetical protein [Gemmatimonadota bacterium]
MMKRSARILILGGVAMLAAACAEQITSSLDQSMLDAAFLSSPLGFENTASSFSTSSGLAGDAFMPGARGGSRGKNLLGGGHDFMGGGFGEDFLGGVFGGGRPFEHGERGGTELSSSCTFSSATGIVTCAAETRGGVTVNRTIVFKTTSGTAQSARDSNTNSITTHITATGTNTRRDSTVITTINHKSDRTVTGLASTATQRTVNGTSAGSETTTGKDSVGTFTVARVIGDTTSGIIIPITSGKPTYPTAGTVIRSMQVTLTYAGKTPATSTRREVVTYDGSATAKLVITQDATTKNCTIPLPRGRPTCS